MVIVMCYSVPVASSTAKARWSWVVQSIGPEAIDDVRLLGLHSMKSVQSKVPTDPIRLPLTDEQLKWQPRHWRWLA
jgi:hypothetical protein